MMAINNFEKFKGETFNVGLSNANLSKLELCNKNKRAFLKVLKYL